MADDLFTAAGIDPAVRAAVIAELRAKAAEFAEHGRNAFPGMCGVMSGWEDGVAYGPDPCGLYSEESTLKHTAAVFKRMLDAPEGVELYQPCNGSEGRAFMARWCENCTADAHFQNGSGAGCEILTNTMALDLDDDEYPRQWRQDGDKGPRCTAFEQRTTIDGQ